MKKSIYLWSTIYNKLLSKGIESIDIDVRYLQRWITLFPCCFPKFMLSFNYETNIVWKNNDFRYEFNKK